MATALNFSMTAVWMTPGLGTHFSAAPLWEAREPVFDCSTAGAQSPSSFVFASGAAVVGLDPGRGHPSNQLLASPEKPGGNHDARSEPIQKFETRLGEVTAQIASKGLLPGCLRWWERVVETFADARSEQQLSDTMPVFFPGGPRELTYGAALRLLRGDSSDLRPTELGRHIAGYFLFVAAARLIRDWPASHWPDVRVEPGPAWEVVVLSEDSKIGHIERALRETWLRSNPDQRFGFLRSIRDLDELAKGDSRRRTLLLLDGETLLRQRKWFSRLKRLLQDRPAISDTAYFVSDDHVRDPRAALLADGDTGPRSYASMARRFWWRMRDDLAEAVEAAIRIAPTTADIPRLRGVADGLLRRKPEVEPIRNALLDELKKVIAEGDG